MNQTVTIPDLGETITGSPLVTEAAFFAAHAHGAIEQKRKYTGEAYIHHPAAVAKIVAAVTGDDCWFGDFESDSMIAAAWLHDVVEDTPVTIYEVGAAFGPEVSELVGWVTDVSTPDDGNRAQRKRIDREHLAAAPAAAQTIKLADLIHNTQSIVRYDPAFARVYLAEKDALLGVLTQGSPVLWRRARMLCDEGMRSHPF